jgi:hypothetical protein
MIVGQEEHFKLLIGNAFLHLRPGDISPIAGGGIVNGELTLDRAMRAQLDGGSDFRIVPRQNDASFQLIPTSDYARWAWDISPLHSGNLVLTLRVFGQTRLGADNVEIVKEVSIPVKADVVGQLKVFVGQYWQWAWTALLVPLIAALRASKKRRANGAS